MMKKISIFELKNQIHQMHRKLNKAQEDRELMSKKIDGKLSKQN